MGINDESSKTGETTEGDYIIVSELTPDEEYRLQQLDRFYREVVAPAQADLLRELDKADSTPDAVTLPEGIERPSFKPEAPVKVETNSTTGDEYVMGGKRFTVTPDVRAAFEAIHESDGIPVEGAIAVCARESDCNPQSINPVSGACGLFQFMADDYTATLYEAMWKYGEERGYPEARELVERYVRGKNADGLNILGYRPVSEEAREQAIELCLKPAFNASMWAGYKGPHVERYNDWLGNRTITGGEFVIMNNLGKNGLQNFAEQAWTDKKTGLDTMATDFFSAVIAEQNPSLVRDKEGNDLTVRESYSNVINNFGGWGALQIARN